MSSISAVDRLSSSPLDVKQTILEYVGDAATITSAGIAWRYDPDIVSLRTASIDRLRQIHLTENAHREMGHKNYPENMVQLFGDHGSPIWRLPILDLGNRRGITGYIDFLRPEEMTHPVMRFKDCQKRVGVALQLKGKSDEVLQTGMGNYPIRDLRGVLVLFQRYRGKSTWSLSCSNLITMAYNKKHDENGHEGPSIMACPNCPFVGVKVNDAVLSKLLRNEDPLFELPGHQPGNPDRLKPLPLQEGNHS
jgi:hypothetical protein